MNVEDLMMKRIPDDDVYDDDKYNVHKIISKNHDKILNIIFPFSRFWGAVFVCREHKEYQVIAQLQRGMVEQTYFKPNIKLFTIY